MLMRILIIMALVGLALYFVKKTMGARTPPPDRSRQTSTPDGDKLVECAHCGARLPASDAVWKEGHTYCSMTHRNFGPAKR